LNQKSEALEAFKGFKTWAEKEAGTSIKCLRTDRGDEYNSKEFTEFCSTHGVNRQLTAAYTPQQNGVAEQKNRTIMNMVPPCCQRNKCRRNYRLKRQIGRFTFLIDVQQQLLKT